MEILKRGQVIAGLDEELEELYYFHDFPVYMGVSENEEDADLCADLGFQIGRRTGMISVSGLIPEDILYQKAHYNNIAESWIEHHKAFAEFIGKYPISNVFEIGGGCGLLSRCYQEVSRDVGWTILEPLPNPIKDCLAKYIPDFFNKNYQIPPGFDAVIHTHTLEHFYDPLESIKSIAKSMKKDSWMFMSVPNMEEMYKRCYTNVLNFEHTYYCAEPYISYMLSEGGYELVERQMFKDEHSIFYAARKADVKTGNRDNFSGCYEKNKALFIRWLEYHQNLVAELNTRLEKADMCQEIYLFGAHVYSQFLISFGMKTDRILGILDNDISKQNKRLSGTGFRVFAPDVLENAVQPLVILHAGTHNGEIRRQISQINQNVQFI